MFVTGPNVVKTVTNEEVSFEELGGASTHSTKSGVTHLTAANDVECLTKLKRLLSYFPQNCEELPQNLDYTLGEEMREELEHIIPENVNQPYDIREVIEGLTDENSFFEDPSGLCREYCSRLCSYGRKKYRTRCQSAYEFSRGT